MLKPLQPFDIHAMSEKLHDLKPRTKAFALRVIRLYSELPKNDTVVQVLGKQVLRSGTSVGASYREASRGRSKAEFISKIGDCLKEIEETEYWLELLVDSGCVVAGKMSGLLDETRQLIAIFTTIDKNSKKTPSLFTLEFNFQNSTFRSQPS
jgi:four helix bundle protein